MPKKRTGVKIQRSAKAGIVNVEPIYIDDREHYCTCCGRAYERLGGNFTKSNSPLFAGNGGYVSICNACRDGLYENLAKEVGDNAAIERICQLFDLPYVDESIGWDVADGRTKLTAYVAGLNLTQNGNQVTYTKGYLTEKKVRRKQDISDQAVKLFGRGYGVNEYADLMGYYRDVIDTYGEPQDADRTTTYASIALLDYQIRKAGRSTPKEIGTLLNARTNTISTAGLKKKASSMNETLGLTIRDIETMTPAEFYKDKKLYKDFFGIGQYIERFFTRVMRNMLTGTREEDPEYSVGDDDADES